MNSSKAPFPPQSFSCLNSISENCALLHEKLLVQRWPTRHRALWLIIVMICLGTLLANLLFCLPSLSSPIEENVYYKVRPTASTVTATPDEAKKSFAKPAGI